MGDGAPGTRFLALSVSDAAEDVIATIRAGARGYVTKSISGPELADAVRQVAAGDAVFSPRLAGFVLDAFAGSVEVAEIDEELDRLTPRERDVMRLDRAGLHLSRGGVGALPVDQDHRDARVQRAAQAAAVEPQRARPMGVRSPTHLTP